MYHIRALIANIEKADSIDDVNSLNLMYHGIRRKPLPEETKRTPLQGKRGNQKISCRIELSQQLAPLPSRYHHLLSSDGLLPPLLVQVNSRHGPQLSTVVILTSAPTLIPTICLLTHRYARGYLEYPEANLKSPPKAPQAAAASQ